MKTQLLYSIATVFTFSITALIVNTSVNTLSNGFTYRKLIKQDVKKEYYLLVDSNQSINGALQKGVNNNNSEIKFDSTVKSEIRPPLNLRPIEKAKEVFYAVQVGVCNSNFIPSSFLQFDSLNTENLKCGITRYSFGRFRSLQDAELAKISIIEKGIKGAFVTAYINSSRYTISQLNQFTSISKGKSNNLSEEFDVNRNIISFTKSNRKAVIQKINSKEKINNNLKYTVVLGEHKNFIPNNTATVYLQLKMLGLKTVDVGERTYYCLGEFSNKSEAEFLKEEVASMGVENARIVNYTKDILLCLK